ncbi:hypothetical protein M5C90_11185 [Pseudomonas chlororaphis subsp. piscium]|nr:hypothetical protein M5C90_11185 [Pseudomonas chlororaphis subsp. piscium]
MPSEAGVVKLRAVQHLSLLTNKSAIMQNHALRSCALMLSAILVAQLWPEKLQPLASGFIEKA